MMIPNANFYSRKSLFKLEAITYLHVGSGRGLGIVDLPVQRDHLGFPAVFGSSIKGALKTLAMMVDEKRAKELFGREPMEKEGGISQVLFTDFLLAAIPVRSLYGIYGLATSPFLIERLKDLSETLGLSPPIGSVPRPDAGNAYVSRENLLAGNGGSTQWDLVLNEEFYYRKKENEVVSGLSRWLGADGRRLVVVPDDDIRELVESSIIAYTRVRLDRDVKIVQKGGLWVEEYVPPKTVFVGAVLSRGEGIEEIRSLLNAEDGRIFFFLGGKESVGKGLVLLEEIKHAGEAGG